MNRMIRGLSRAASHDGRSTEATPERGAGTKPAVSMELGSSRVPGILRLLQLLVLAIVTVVCAGVTSPARAIASLAPSIEVAAHDSADAERRGMAPEPPQQRRHDIARPVVDLDAVEADIDDDGDPLPDVADDRPAAFRGVCLPRRPGRPLRVEPQVDTSRLAFGRGLPRGPPT